HPPDSIVVFSSSSLESDGAFGTTCAETRCGAPGFVARAISPKLYGEHPGGSMTRASSCPTFPPMRIALVRGTSTEQIDLIPSKIVGIGLNYRAHAAEMGKGLPEEPLLFLKPPSSMIAGGEPIERPAGYERVDYEGELGVVIGQRARRVPRE